MSSTLRLSQISARRQDLVRLCQQTNHGQIQRLEVRDSDPVLWPPPLVLVDVKLDSSEEPRPELGLLDFVLSREVHGLLAQLDEIGNGRIERIEVRAGIPRRVVFESRPLRGQEERR